MTALAHSAWHRCTPGNCSPAPQPIAPLWVSSPRARTAATSGSCKSRMGKTASFQFQLWQYQKRTETELHAAFSASTAAKKSSKVIIFALTQDFISTTKWKHICTLGPRTEQPRSQTSTKWVYSCIIDLSQNTPSKVILVWFFFPLQMPYILL